MAYLHDQRIARALTADEQRLRTWIGIEDWIKIANRLASSFAAFLSGAGPAGTVFAGCAIVSNALVVGSSMGRAIEGNMEKLEATRTGQVQSYQVTDS